MHNIVNQVLDGGIIMKYWPDGRIYGGPEGSNTNKKEIANKKKETRIKKRKRKLKKEKGKKKENENKKKETQNDKKKTQIKKRKRKQKNENANKKAKRKQKSKTQIKKQNAPFRSLQPLELLLTHRTWCHYNVGSDMLAFFSTRSNSEKWKNVLMSIPHQHFFLQMMGIPALNSKFSFMKQLDISLHPRYM